MPESGGGSSGDGRSGERYKLSVIKCGDLRYTMLTMVKNTVFIHLELCSERRSEVFSPHKNSNYRYGN